MGKLDLRGVVVATVLPFTEAGAIDWQSYRRLLDYCATPDGVSAVFVNGHAGEGATLTSAERAEVIAVTKRNVDGGKPLLAGIIAYSTAEAIAQAQEAKSAGADVAVLFPLPQFAGAMTARPEMALAYVKAVSEAVDMPISIFQYPLATSGYGTETLVEIARLPGVIAIKEGSDTMLAYEENWRRVKAAAAGVAMLPSNFDWFLAQLAVGADGILSGLASLTPHWLVELWRAGAANDLAAMRTASDRLHPVVRAIYGAAPKVDMHTRIKVALQHLCIIACAAPRAPLLPVSAEIAAGVRRAVDEADLAALTQAAAPSGRRAAE